MRAHRPAESVLTEGCRLGSYEIVSFAGAGGMGQVYRARDIRLGRIVALKILPDISANPAGRARFLSEARAISSLKHPNVCTLHDIGSEAGVDFIVMEFVEGETLERRLLRGPLPLREALQHAAVIASALDAAHTAGIVHRDVKPGNIMLTKSGAKLLDFGLATLPVQAGQNTEDAAVGGTLHYMSPELLDGDPADARSDVFAFGAVLYEMLTGNRAFKGETRAAVVAAILGNDPPSPSVQRRTALPMLDKLVQRCLEKDPEGRLQNARDVRHFLEWISEQPPDRAGERERPATRFVLPGLVVLLTIAVAAFMYDRRPRAPVTAISSSYAFKPVETTPAFEGFPAWSPDGKTIAYVAETGGTLQIFTRSMQTTMRTQITHLPRDGREPFWSPDGTKIFFISLARERDGLWSVGAAGGAPQLVLPNVSSAAISPDGRSLALLRDSAASGESTSLWFAGAGGEDARKYSDPTFSGTLVSGTVRYSRDGARLGVWVEAGGTTRQLQFWEISLPSMKPRLLPILAQLPRVYPFDWMPDGRRIVFGADFDDTRPGFHLWTADTRTGRLQPITATHSNEYYPSVSPDGTRIVFTSQEADFDLIEIPLDGGPTRSVLATSRVEKMPVWSPDGSQIAFVTNRGGGDEIWVRSADGAWERPVAAMKDFPGGSTYLLSGLSFSPDGKRVAYQRAAGMFRVWISSIVGGAPTPLLNPQKVLEDHPAWSPDGNWIAFTSFVDTKGDAPVRHPALFKTRLGSDQPPVVLQDMVVAFADVKWSPAGDWILCETVDGMTLVSPDGKPSRVLAEESWIAHEWARDGRSVYAIRTDDDLHLSLIRMDVKTGMVTQLRDLGVSPPMTFPFLGLSLAADSRSLITSVPNLRGDLWILEGFETIP